MHICALMEALIYLYRSVLRSGLFIVCLLTVLCGRLVYLLMYLLMFFSFLEGVGVGGFVFLFSWLTLFCVCVEMLSNPSAMQMWRILHIFII